MTPQLTMLASAFGIALVGSAFLPQQTGPDNTVLSSSPIDDRTVTDVYADYFPSDDVDATDGVALRIQRDLASQPVFWITVDPDSLLQRKLAQARKTNQRPQARRAVTSRARSAKYSKYSTTSGVTQRRGGRQTIVELARTRLGSLSHNRFKNLSRRNRQQLRRQKLRRAQSRPQPRLQRRSNVRERLRLNASRSSSNNN